MAAEEVIYFPFWAQPYERRCSSAVCPPEPVAEPPPSLRSDEYLVLSGTTSASPHGSG